MEQSNHKKTTRYDFIHSDPPRKDKDIDDLIFESEIPKTCSDR